MNKHYKKINYQGLNHNETSKYFEGWYFKQVTFDGKDTISFIPGISYNKEDPHCFIQCIYLNERDELTTYYIRYDIDAFRYEEDPFTIRIGDCIFAENYLVIYFKTDDINVSGVIYMKEGIKLNRSMLQPNIMGFFSYIPNMECNHEIIDMSNNLSGQLKVNNKMLNFDGGKGYIEKDWGKSFPKNYIWLQCNHFNKENVSITCSIARIPFGKFAFQGFFCNFIIQGKEYRFATYNNSKVKIIKANNDHFNIMIINKKYKMQIKGKVKASETLIAPKEGAMINTIKEGISGQIQIILKDRNNNLIINTRGVHCGIEIVN